MKQFLPDRSLHYGQIAGAAHREGDQLTLLCLGPSGVSAPKVLQPHFKTESRMSLETLSPKKTGELPPPHRLCKALCRGEVRMTKWALEVYAIQLVGDGEGLERLSVT